MGYEMKLSDEQLRAALSQAQANKEFGTVPAFGTTLARAETRLRARRRRHGMLAGSAAVLALAFFMLKPSEEEFHYINTAELLETTSWSAPSDSLMPERQYDIYGEMPVLIESTETYGGALL